MPIIDKYIARNFLSGAAIVLLIVLPLFAFLTLSEELEEVGKGVFTSLDALAVVGFSLPKLALDLLPVTALLGVLIGLGTMANHRELIAIRAAGFSVQRTVWPVVEVIVVVIIVVLILQFYVIPDFETSAARIRSKSTPQTSITTGDSEFWTRSGDQFIRIGRVIQHGTLQDIEIFDMGARGELQELVQASSVEVLGEDQWLLQDVDLTDLRSDTIREEHLDSKMWRSSLSEQQTSALIVPVEAMAPSALYRYIRLLDKNKLDTHRYRVIFWQQLSIPVGLLAMSLLGFPFLIGSVRSIPAGQRAAIGGSIGILFYLSEQMMGQLAVLFELSPSMAALAPDVSILVLALVILRRIS